jgi:hypothetical protein
MGTSRQQGSVYKRRGLSYNQINPSRWLTRCIYRWWQRSVPRGCRPLHPSSQASLQGMTYGWASLRSSEVSLRLVYEFRSQYNIMYPLYSVSSCCLLTLFSRAPSLFQQGGSNTIGCFGYNLLWSHTRCTGNVKSRGGLEYLTLSSHYPRLSAEFFCNVSAKTLCNHVFCLYSK